MGLWCVGGRAFALFRFALLLSALFFCSVGKESFFLGWGWLRRRRWRWDAAGSKNKMFFPSCFNVGPSSLLPSLAAAFSDTE